MEPHWRAVRGALVDRIMQLRRWLDAALRSPPLTVGLTRYARTRDRELLPGQPGRRA